MFNRIRIKLHRRWYFTSILAAPTTAFAYMPPVEVLLIPPLFCMIAITMTGWFATRFLHNLTARHFSRVLLMALLWTPVPMITLQNYGFGFMFSGIHLWSFLLTRGAQSSMYATAEAGRTHLAVAIAVGVVSVLGGVVVLARSVARLRQSRL